MRHVVTDTIGHPSQRKFTQISRPEHQTIVQIRESKEVGGSFSGLHILEGEIIDLLSLRVGMADVPEHLDARRPYVDLPGFHPKRLHQPPGITDCEFTRCEAWHSISQD